MARCVLIALGLAATLLGNVLHAHALPTAEAALDASPFSAADRKRILAGEIVTADIPAVSTRDLSVAIGFLVRTSPQELANAVLTGALSHTDDQMTARGELSRSGELRDFGALQLQPGGEKVAATYVGDSVDEELNFSREEIAGFRKLAGQSGLLAAVEARLHTVLLERYRAYRARGLEGITGYARGSKTADVAGDLRKAGDMPMLEKYAPAAHRVLQGYPAATVPGMRESFFWVNNDIDDLPTIALTHLMTAADGEAHIVLQRQFYANRSYNCQQAVAAFLPVENGTLVIYANHTFTDQITGMGGTVKQGIGRKIMAGTLVELFDEARKAAEKQ